MHRRAGGKGNARGNPDCGDRKEQGGPLHPSACAPSLFRSSPYLLPLRLPLQHRASFSSPPLALKTTQHPPTGPGKRRLDTHHRACGLPLPGFAGITLQRRLSEAKTEEEQVSSSSARQPPPRPLSDCHRAAANGKISQEGDFQSEAEEEFGCSPGSGRGTREAGGGKLIRRQEMRPGLHKTPSTVAERRRYEISHLSVHV